MTDKKKQSFVQMAEDKFKPAEIRQAKEIFTKNPGEMFPPPGGAPLITQEDRAQQYAQNPNIAPGAPVVGPGETAADPLAPPPEDAEFQLREGEDTRSLIERAVAGMQKFFGGDGGYTVKVPPKEAAKTERGVGAAPAEPNTVGGATKPTRKKKETQVDIGENDKNF